MLRGECNVSSFSKRFSMPARLHTRPASLAGAAVFDASGIISHLAHAFVQEGFKKYFTPIHIRLCNTYLATAPARASLTLRWMTAAFGARSHPASRPVSCCTSSAGPETEPEVRYHVVMGHPLETEGRGDSAANICKQSVRLLVSQLHVQPYAMRVIASQSEPRVTQSNHPN